MKIHIGFILGTIIGCIVCIIVFSITFSQIFTVFICTNLGYWGRVIIEKN